MTIKWHASERNCPFLGKIERGNRFNQLRVKLPLIGPEFNLPFQSNTPWNARIINQSNPAVKLKNPAKVLRNPIKNTKCKWFFHTCRPPYPIVVCVSTENKNADVQESTLSTQTTPLSYWSRSQKITNQAVPNNDQLKMKPAEYNAITHRHFASIRDVKKSARNRSLFLGTLEERKCTFPLLFTKRFPLACEDLRPFRDGE